jgi:hypothetical protein
MKKVLFLVSMTFVLISCQKQVDYTPQIQELTNRVNALQNSLNSSIAALQKSRDSLATALTQTNTNLATTNTNVSGLSTRMDSVKTALFDINSKLTRLTLRIDSANTQIALLNTQMASSISNTASLTSQITIINNNITNFTNSINILNQQYNTLIIILIGIQSQLNVTSNSLSSGLVAWYPFTGNAIDSSTYGNNGSVVGPSLTTDRFGKTNSAYNFNGSSYISVPHANQLNFGNNSFSISCWALCTGTSRYQHIVTKGDVPYPTKSFYLRYDNDQLDFTSGNGATEAGIYTRSIVQVANKQNWHNIIVNYNATNSTSYLYYDGKLVKQSSIIPNLSNTTGPMYFGVENPVIQLPSGPQYFTGKIDEIRLYNRVLTDTEIDYLSKN